MCLQQRTQAAAASAVIPEAAAALFGSLKTGKSGGVCASQRRQHQPALSESSGLQSEPVK